MNYWHMQLHPDDKLSTETLVSILKTKEVIGLGDAWNDKNGNPVSDPTLFKNEMQIGDVVMVRNTITPVALVRITGNAYIEENIVQDFDWFTLRRDVKILDYYGNSEKESLDRILKKYNNNHIQAPGTLTKCLGAGSTNDFIKLWHKQAIRKQIMDNIRLTLERQIELKTLWNKFKEEFYEKGKPRVNAELDKLIKEWNQYKAKIINDTFSLDDYTNRLNRNSEQMPGGYLCNFLERTTSTVFGSSKPGSAINFGVKLNDDGTYTIGKNNPQEKREKAEEIFLSTIKPLIINIVNTNEASKKIDFVENSSYAAKQLLRKLAVLDNLGDFLFIYSDGIIDNLHNEFLNSEEISNLGKNYEIRLVINKILELDKYDPVESVLLSNFLWSYANTQSITDKDTPNVILYGPPGTGKTYAVKNSLDFICQGDRSRYEFVQFHPSFTYEDFIEGIKPKGVTKEGAIKFELVDGVFKRFCKRAKDNPAKEYYFVVDEINRANLSAVFGEALLCLEKEYRHDVNNQTGLIKTQYSVLIEEMIKEDPENESLAYHYQDGNAYFGVPSNLFFIGMMNDVDKSIDAFDLALRRRFKWIRKDCDYDVIEQNTKYRNGEEFTNIENYVKACYKLNNYISNELGLGKSYEFGHSFFMKISAISSRKDITSKNVENLFNLHLRPTLKEYLRAMFAESDLDQKLDEALSKFILPFKTR